MTRRHILTLDVGDRFRFAPEGPAFRRAPDSKEGQVMVEQLDGKGRGLKSLLEYEGCFVLPVEDEAEDGGPES